MWVLYMLVYIVVGMVLGYYASKSYTGDVTLWERTCYAVLWLPIISMALIKAIVDEVCDRVDRRMRNSEKRKK